MSGFMGLIFSVIVGIGVAIPITTAVVTTANLTGTDATIAGFLVTLILVAILAMIARMGGLA